MTKKILKKSVQKLFNFLRKTFFNSHTNEIHFFSGKHPDKEKIDEIVERLKYFEFDKHVKIDLKPSLSFSDYFDFSILVFLDGSNIPRGLKIKKDRIFDLDYESNYLDGWAYHYLLSKINVNDYNEGLRYGNEKLALLKTDLSKRLKKAYIFGTGPSLEKAIDYDFNDGIRIVSNTIVKDEELWLHINPHFIVAGDAIYHFGFSRFAINFRKDLNLRLRQTDTCFLYPAHFHPFCLKEFPAFKNRLIPVPIGLNDTILHYNLLIDYSLPRLGNVLLLLLLPLACTLSDNIFLWGFDGRAPDDKLFWKNSSKHFYNDDVEQLKTLHPLFFETLVPKSAPDSYVKAVHGDVLENALEKAEADGYSFEMMHPSYTETLKKRYKG